MRRDDAALPVMNICAVLMLATSGCPDNTAAPGATHSPAVESPTPIPKRCRASKFGIIPKLTPTEAERSCAVDSDCVISALIIGQCCLDARKK